MFQHLFVGNQKAIVYKRSLLYHSIESGKIANVHCSELMIVCILQTGSRRHF